MLFVYRPDNAAIAMESRAHWKRQVDILEARLETARGDLARLQEIYDINPGFDNARKFNVSAEELAETKRMLKAARNKLNWEDAKKWARLPRPERGLAKYKKLLLKSIDWDKILKRDPVNPEDE